MIEFYHFLLVLGGVVLSVVAGVLLCVALGWVLGKLFPGLKEIA